MLSKERDVYEELRADVKHILGASCRPASCKKLAHSVGHKHREWVEQYAEWLVKIAVLEDCLFHGGPVSRHAMSWMEEHPMEKMVVHAERRAA